MRLEQKEKRKLEIIIASIDIFVMKGYTGTKIQDIAKAAGMSVGLLFHYFKNKEELFNELTKIAVEGTNLPYGMYYDSIYDFFLKLTDYLFVSIQEQPYRAKIFSFMSMVRRSDDVPTLAKKIIKNSDVFNKLESFIKNGQENGTINQENPKILTQLYWSMIQNTMDQYIYNPKLPLPNSKTIVSILKVDDCNDNQDNDDKLYTSIV
ncbi:TetR/AcrR family transcriptional regulator [Anaerorhabdus sp.]|uniref:TetR/AcrR family transcriptional regulator n=1 Tax=Anaerorhabdus sp. TaxID=1872524 RepID=UPI002FCC841D